MSPENKALIERYYKILPAHIAPQQMDFSVVDFLLNAAREEGRAEGLAALHALRDDYHTRGCQGREYTCTCGYDERVEAAIGAPLDTKGGDNG